MHYIVMEQDGKSRGFGFVQFKEPHTAYELINKDGGHEIHGTEVSVRASTNNSPIGPQGSKGKGKDGFGKGGFGMGYGKGGFGIIGSFF